MFDFAYLFESVALSLVFFALRENRIIWTKKTNVYVSRFQDKSISSHLNHTLFISLFFIFCVTMINSCEKSFFALHIFLIQVLNDYIKESENFTMLFTDLTNTFTSQRFHGSQYILKGQTGNGFRTFSDLTLSPMTWTIFGSARSHGEFQ